MLVEQEARSSVDDDDVMATEHAAFVDDHAEDARTRQSECVVNVHAEQLRVRLAALHLDVEHDGSNNRSRRAAAATTAHRRAPRARRSSTSTTTTTTTDDDDNGSNDCHGSSGEWCSRGRAMPRNIVAGLPADVLQALLAELDALQREEATAGQRVAEYDAQTRQLQQRADELAEQTERAKSAVAFLSEKSSAELQRFRAHLQQTMLWSREHTKEMADVRRQQERAEHELRRAELEMTRLQNIAKRVQ